MSWRIVSVGSKAKLDYKMDYLVVRTEQKTTRVHLSEIALLMLTSPSVSLTAYLVCELTKHKIKVVFCDEKASPLCEVMPLYGSHDSSRKVREQIVWDTESKALIHAEIIRAKVMGQRAVLPPQETEARTLLSSYLPQILPGDPTNREGHAAKVYFNALFGKSFSRTDDTPVNAALNYGYSILLSAFNREVSACGYLTQLGIFHDNVFNHFNLSCDLMEPFRPFVDAKVVGMQPVVQLAHEEKMTLLDILNLKISYDGRTEYLSRAISLYTHSVFDALRERDVSEMRFPAYELSLYETSGLL